MAGDQFVYRISTSKELDELKRDGFTYGGDLDKSTRCIHFSNLNQVKMVLHNFYKGREDLHLLQIDPAKLGEGLVYEGAIEDESKVFPHFYGPERSFGPLDFESVVGVEKLELVGGDFTCRFLH